MVRTQSSPSAFPFLSESSSPDVCLSFCAALPSSHTRTAPPRSLSPLPTGREELQPGFSGPSSWLQATFKEWGLSPHLLPPLPPVPPFALPLWPIPAPAPKSASSRPHPHSVNQMDKPKGLGPETGPEQTHRWGPSPRQTDRHAAGTLRPRETSRP